MSQEHLEETEKPIEVGTVCHLNHEGTCDCCWLGIARGEDWQWVLVGFSFLLLLLVVVWVLF